MAGSLVLLDEGSCVVEGFAETESEVCPDCKAGSGPGNAQPFIDTLSELVQAQADRTGFVVLHRWAEFLERHFSPELPGPDHITE